MLLNSSAMDTLKETYDQATELFSESRNSAKARLAEYLSDTICEFVDTNCLTGEEFFEVLVACVRQNWDYYQKNADCNLKLLRLLQPIAQQQTEGYGTK